MTQTLTKDDVDRLLADPSAENRAGVVEKLAQHLTDPSAGEAEQTLGVDIVRAMTRDVSDLVRRSLSLNLKSWPELPRDVALSLARDVDEVAVPVLQDAVALSDDDLVMLVGESGEAKQVAIAQRPQVSSRLADALVDTDNKSVARALVQNQSADLQDDALSRIVDRFGADEDIQEPLVHRATLPPQIAERMVAKLSDRLLDYLVTHHSLPEDVAEEVMSNARERATVTMLRNTSGYADRERLVEQMLVNGRLTPSIILRALCTGDMPFFEVSLARMARVPVINARVLIHDAGTLGLKSLYEKAQLPAALYPATRVAVEVVRDTDMRSHDFDPESYSRMVLERILTLVEEELTPEDQDYLLRKFQDLAPTASAA